MTHSIIDFFINDDFLLSSFVFRVLRHFNQTPCQRMNHFPAFPKLVSSDQILLFHSEYISAYLAEQPAPDQAAANLFVRRRRKKTPIWCLGLKGLNPPVSLVCFVNREISPRLQSGHGFFPPDISFYPSERGTLSLVFFHDLFSRLSKKIFLAILYFFKAAQEADCCMLYVTQSVWFISLLCHWLDFYAELNKHSAILLFFLSTEANSPSGYKITFSVTHFFHMLH